MKKKTSFFCSMVVTMMEKEPTLSNLSLKLSNNQKLVTTAVAFVCYQIDTAFRRLLADFRCFQGTFSIPRLSVRCCPAEVGYKMVQVDIV
jgi:hypothetical protein